MSFPYEDFVQHIQTIKDYVDNRTPELPGSFPVATEVIDVNLSAFDFTRTNSGTPEHECRLTADNDGKGCWAILEIVDQPGSIYDGYPVRQQVVALSGNRSPILLTLERKGMIMFGEKAKFVEIPVKAGDLLNFTITNSSNYNNSAYIYDLTFINSSGVEDKSSLTETNDSANPWTVENNSISISIANNSSTYSISPTVDGTIKFRAVANEDSTKFALYHISVEGTITKKICCQYANHTEGGMQYIDKDSGLLVYLSTDVSQGLETYDGQVYQYNNDTLHIYLPQDCKYSWYDWNITKLEYSMGRVYDDTAESVLLTPRWEANISIPLQLPFSAVFVPDLETGSYINTNKVTFDTKVETGKVTITTLGQLLPKLSGKLYITQTDKFGKCSIDLGSSYYKKINGLPLSQGILSLMAEYGSEAFVLSGKDWYKPITFNDQTTYNDIGVRSSSSSYGSSDPIYCYSWGELDLPLFTIADTFGTSGAVKIRLNALGGLPISNNNRIGHIVDSIPLCKLSVDLFTDSQGNTKSSTIELARDATIGSFSYAGGTFPSGQKSLIKWRYDKVIKENNILYNTESSTYTLTFTKDGTVSFLYQDDYPGGSYHQNSIKISKNGTDLVTGYAPMSYTEFSQTVSAGDTILITASKENAQARFYIKDITFSETDGMTQENNETAPWQVKSESQSFYVSYNNGICYYYNEIEELKDLYICDVKLMDNTTIMEPVGAYEYPLDVTVTVPSFYSAGQTILDCGIIYTRGLTSFAYVIQRLEGKISVRDEHYVIPYSTTITNSDIPGVKVNVPRPITSGNSTKIIDKDYLTAYNEGLIVKPIVGANIAIPPAIKGQFTLELNLSWGTNKSSSLMTVSPPMGDRTIEFTGFPVFNVAKPFIEYYKDIGYTVTGMAQTFIPLVISDLLMSEAGGLDNSMWGYLPITDKYNNAFINLGHSVDDGITLGELVSKNPFTLTVSVYSIPSQTDKYTGTLLKDAWHTYTFEGETTTDVYSSTTDYLDYNHKVAVNDAIDISYNSGGNYGSGERKGYINNLVFTPDDTSKIGTDYMVITNSDTNHPWVVNSDGTITVEINETYYSTHYNIKFTAPGTVSFQYKCGGRGNIDIERTTAGVTVWAADIKKAPTANDATDDNVMDIDNPYYFGICDSELTINYPYEIYIDTLQETDGSYTLRAIYTGETKPDKDMDYELLCRTNTRVYTSQNKVQLKVNNNYNWFADAVTTVFGEQ